MDIELWLVVAGALLVLGGLAYILLRNQLKTGKDDSDSERPPPKSRGPRRLAVPRGAPTGTGDTPGVEELLSAERYDEAARLAMRHHNWGEAVDYYLRAEQPANAAHAARLGEDLAKAAELFARCGDFDAAAGCLDRTGNRAGAREMRAAGKQARKEDRQPGERRSARSAVPPPAGDSITELRALIGSSRCDLGNIEVFYRLALALEQAGQPQEARDAYVAVENTSPGYRDADARAQKLPATR